MLTERSREIPWLLNKAIGARNLLDIGAAGSKYLPALSQVAHKVTAIDTRPFTTSYGVEGYVMDAANMAAEWTAAFDVVTCLSVLDHVGLDAYGNQEDESALPKVAAELLRVLQPGGRLLVTAPVGRPQLTTHPNGGQRVFDPTEFMTMFHPKQWALISWEQWKRRGEDYESATLEEVESAEYGGLYAEACMALELIRL